MRILHTADWHLGNRLGRIDRTADLRKAVERIGEYCQREAVDVLLVAGDLFSEHSRAETLRETIEHWQTVFNGFLARGGTIVTLTGNHDNENFCQTLSHAMSLAAPTFGGPGELVSPGRLYLATRPTLLRLKDPKSPSDVQFILLPYATPSQYLTDESNRKYDSASEKHAKLTAALLEELRTIQRHDRFDRRLPTVLSAHLQVEGAIIGQGMFSIPPEDDITFKVEDLPSEYAYVALGHVHKPQVIRGQEHVRYSGSIERMDLGEANDDKSVVIVDLGPQGLLAPPRLLPMPSTDVYEVQVVDPLTDLDRLEAKAANATRDASGDLVNLRIRYTAGTIGLEEILRRLDALYPRWYERDWTETGELGPTLSISAVERTKSFAETVRDYVRTELTNHPDFELDDILPRVEALLASEALP
jgi:DNA repair protein SbcD/Mre11